MDNLLIRNGRRKSPGPQRSATPLDNFLTPGILFRFPSDFSDSKMPATFVSACNPNSIGKYSFSNINTDSIDPMGFPPKNEFKQMHVFDDSEFSSCCSARSTTPLSSSSIENYVPINNSMNVLQEVVKSSKRRRCESCGTRRTPYWRDGWEPGIILCNACGIRFHKYRRHCEKCYCIAKKDDKGRIHCPKCFEIL